MPIIFYIGKTNQCYMIQYLEHSCHPPCFRVLALNFLKFLNGIFKRIIKVAITLNAYRIILPVVRKR